MLEFEALSRESSLASCEPLVGLILPRRGRLNFRAVGGHLDSLIELVDLRNWQMMRARPFSSFHVLDEISMARAHLISGDYSAAYMGLCGAYTLMQEELGFDQSPAPPVQNNGSGPQGGPLVPEVTPIVPDEIVNGQISPQLDVGVYSFDVTEERKIHLLEDPGRKIEANLRVLREDDTLLCEGSNVEGDHGHLDLYCNSDSVGTHHVIVMDTSNNETGSYELFLRLLEPDAPEEPTCPSPDPCRESPF